MNCSTCGNPVSADCLDHDDESAPEYNLWRKLGERRYLAEAAQREAEIRTELAREVRLAIDYALGHNHLVQLTGVQLDAAAGAAVDALAGYYRAECA